MRMEAHEVFDQLWRQGPMSRNEAYVWLARKLSIPPQDCHFQMMGTKMLQKSIDTINADVHPNQFTSGKEFEDFVLLGNATFTVVSQKTGKRFTYKVKAAPPRDGLPANPTLYFVSVLNGPDNEGDYAYMGELRLKLGAWMFNRGRKSRLNEYSTSMVAFQFFWTRLMNKGDIHPLLEVWHEGRCGKCNRKLTDPVSIERGIGPDCAEMLGL